MTGMAPHAEALTHFEFEQADILLAAVHIALDHAALGMRACVGQLDHAQVRHFEAANIFSHRPHRVRRSTLPKAPDKKRERTSAL